MNTSFLRLLPTALLAICLIGCGGGSGSYGSDGDGDGDGGGVDGGGNGGNGGGGGGGALTYTVGGTVSGLNGTVVLRNNGADDLTVSADGAFAFSTALANDSAYNVTLRAQPAFPAQDCIIADGSGAASANVTNVAVVCSTLASAQLQADAGVRSTTLSWTSPSDASSFNVYLSSQRNCDIRNFASCPDGALLMNVSSPRTVGELRNGQAYFFRIETVYANGARGLSNEGGARPNALAFNDTVRAIATAEDGTVYLGGNFTQVGVTTGSAVPLDARGRVAVPDFPIVNGSVHAIAPDGAGGWYIGGFFTRVADAPRCNLAHVLANGTVDPNFNAEIDHSVDALAVAGSTVYVGGRFTFIDDKLHNHLAAFDASGALLPWNPSASTPQQIDPDTGGPIDPSIVIALAVSGDTVYVGGRFGMIGSSARSHLAAVDAGGHGSVLLQWDPVAHDVVSALAVSGSTVYAGGRFTHIDGEPRNRLAALDTSGSGVLQSWSPSANATVFALAVLDGAVYAGGSFTRIGDTPRASLAALDASGKGAVLPWNPGAGGTVLTFAISGDTVYAGGDFMALGAVPRSRLAATDALGTPLPWDPSADDNVTALAISDSTVYVGGDFMHIGIEPRERLAAIDAGATAIPWNPGADATVNALAVSGSTVYAGGDFTQIGVEPRNHLAAIDADGTLQQSWRPAPNAPVSALAVTGGALYVGGSFTEVVDATSVEPRGRLAAIDAGGEVLPWNPDADGSVNALAILSGTVYASGFFTQIGATPRGGLAAIDANGDGPVVSLWAPAAADGSVDALAVAGSTLYVGGDFTHIGVEPRNFLAAFDAGGEGALRPWNPAADDVVHALEVSGSTVHVGGFFTTLGRSPRFGMGDVSATGDGDAIP